MKGIMLIEWLPQQQSTVRCTATALNIFIAKSNYGAKENWHPMFCFP
jgi:hypothetical protein